MTPIGATTRNSQGAGATAEDAASAVEESDFPECDKDLQADEDVDPLDPKAH